MEKDTVASTLRIEDFNIIGFGITAIPKFQKADNALVENEDIGVDFNILTHVSDKSKYKITLSLSGNTKKPEKPGYSFSLYSEAMFYIPNIETYDKNSLDKLFLHTALPILISHVRTFLINSTCYMPYGRYILPCIDMTYLVDLQKKKEIKKRKTSNTKKADSSNLGKSSNKQKKTSKN